MTKSTISTISTISTKTLHDQLLKEYNKASTPEERKTISRRIYYEVICPETDAEYLYVSLDKRGCIKDLYAPGGSYLIKDEEKHFD